MIPQKERSNYIPAAAPSVTKRKIELTGKYLVFNPIIPIAIE